MVVRRIPFLRDSPEETFAPKIVTNQSAGKPWQFDCRLSPGATARFTACGSCTGIGISEVLSKTIAVLSSADPLLLGQHGNRFGVDCIW